MKRHLIGTHAVAETLRAHAKNIVLMLVADDSPKSPHRETIDEARRVGLTIEVREMADLDAIAKGVRHQGIIAIAGGDYPYIDLTLLRSHVANPGLIVALDEITDIHNFGAIVRSSVALGADGVVTLRDRAAPVNPVVVRASAGATEHARIARVTNLSRALEELAEDGFVAVGLDASASTTLQEVDFTQHTVLVIGSEGRGLRRLVREHCKVLAKIPMSGRLGSLNASVAASIALYEVQRQRGAAIAKDVTPDDDQFEA